jgi:hypothetical protein
VNGPLAGTGNLERGTTPLWIAPLLALAALFWAVSLVHAEDPVVVDLVIDQPDNVTVGDHVSYTLILEVDEGTRVALAPAAFPPEVELIDSPAETRRDLDDGREEVTLKFKVAPFVTGQVELPPLPVRFTNEDGTSGVIEAPGSIILVNSVLTPTDLERRDLKPQATIGTPPATWVAPALAASVGALILLVGAALWRRSVLRRRAMYVPPPKPVGLGPEDLARDALDKAGIAFREDGDYEAYYSALGVVVRRYLSARYDFPAYALTTRELEEEMMERGLDRWQIRVAGGLFSQCDSVVYARYRPASERAEHDLTAAFEIVEMSRPLDLEESADGTSAKEVART